MLASSKREDRCAKASLGRVAATGKPGVRLPERTPCVCITPFIHREIGEKNECRAGKRITRVTTNEVT
jgi:hypothetical protein